MNVEPGKTFTLKGLQPGAIYVIQVQAVPKKGKPSEWSKPIKFYTNGKDTPPAAVTNLIASYDGNGFNATWDGTAAQQEKDFAGFRVTLNSPSFPSITKVYDQVASSFSLNFDSMIFAFGGIANPITIEVFSVDRSGNVSAGVSATAGNEPPAAPTNVSVIAESMGYQVSWDAPTETDYAYSKIYECATVDGEYVHIDSVTATPSSIKVVGYNTRYVKVSHVDTFGGESDLAPEVGISVTPINPVSVDIDPPDQRTSITYTAGVGQVAVQWENPIDQAINGDVAGITVRYAKASSPTNYTWVDIPFTFAAPLTSTIISGLIANTQYEFAVSTFDKVNNRTAYSTTTQVTVLADTTPPPKPKAPTVAAGTSAGGPLIIRVTQESIENGTTKPLPEDTAYFKVFMLNAGQSTAPSTGVAADANATQIGTMVAAYNGGSSQDKFYVPLTSGEQRYFYTRAVDTSGNVSDASSAVQSAAMTVLANAYISDLSADKLRAGRINADEYIQVGTSSEQITIKSTSALGQIFSGTGTYNNTNTGVYIDTSGKFSLKDRLWFDGTDLSLKGNITATGGKFSGNVQIDTTGSGGSLYAGALPDSGARVILNKNGLTAYNASGTSTFTLDAATGAVSVSGYIQTGGAIAPGGAASDVNNNTTTISGNKIRTGSIESVGYQAPSAGSQFAQVGTKFDLSNAEIRSTNFYVSGGSAGFLGVVTSKGLTVQSASNNITYSTWSALAGSMTNSSQAYALQADSGADIILGTLSGNLNPSKIRWLYNGEQRSSIGFEVSDYQDGSTYPSTLVIRSHAVTGAPGKILINAQNSGTIELKGNVTINGYAVETPQSAINRFRNYTDSNQGKPNNITYSNANPVTVGGVTINGDLHFKY